MKRPMTQQEINEIVRAKEANIRYIQDNLGIWGMPFASENDSLKYWRRVQAGHEPVPEVEAGLERI